MSVRTVILGIAALVIAPGASAQELAERVAAVGAGSVTFTYPARPGVEICDRGISMDGSRVMWRGRDRDDPAVRCTSGPVTVEIRVADGLVRDVDVLDLDDVADPETVDLGAVGAQEAAAYFLSLARAGGCAPASSCRSPCWA